MKVKLNGKEIEIPEKSTITDVLKLMEIKNNMIVVEKNLEIIDKSAHKTMVLKDGDVLEIVGFFGGG